MMLHRWKLGRAAIAAVVCGAAALQGQGAADAAPLVASNVFINAAHVPWVGGVLLPDDTDNAFTVLTNGVVDHGGTGTLVDNVDTWQSDNTGIATDFVGLEYAASHRFDSITIELGNQFGDGGDWDTMPNIYILKNPTLVGRTVRPEMSGSWTQVSGAVETTGHVFQLDVTPGAGGTINFDLSGVPEADRTGYGWAVGGVDGNQNISDVFNFLSLTEVWAEGAAAAAPAFPTPASPQAVNIVSNNYNSVRRDNENLTGWRGDAFASVTNGVVEHFNGDGFDNWNGDAAGEINDFIGLHYNTLVKFDTLTVELGNQFADGGDWETVPKIYILKNPVDTGNTPPETDPTNWVELTGAVETTGHVFSELVVPGDGGTISFDLTGIPEAMRTGYGWAIGGVDGNHRESDLAWNFLSFTEVSATGEVVTMVSIVGDANNDGKVDIFDVAVVSNQWGTAGPEGDVNDDGTVDIFDVAVISNNWSPSATSVPEPSSLALAFASLAAMGLAAWRRKSAK